MTDQACHSIAGSLDTLTLFTEDMKFNAAICFFRNGQVDRALDLFHQLHQLNGTRWKGATFWEAKIYATQHHDSMAMAMLHLLPAGFLKEEMLAQKEFDPLMEDLDFIKLKKSLQPGFNVWTGILSLVAIMSFLMGIIFYFGRSKFSAGEKWMALLMFSIAMILFAYISIWTGYASDFPYIRNIWPFLSLLIGPALFFYVKASFKEEFSKKEIMLHMILPGLSFFLLLPAILGDFGVRTKLPADLALLGSSATVLTGQIIFYTIRIHLLVQNEWQVDNNIKSWTRILSLGLKIYTLAFLSYFILVSSSFFNPEWDYAISLIMALGTLGIAYMGFLQKRVFSSEPMAMLLPVKKYQSSNLTVSASETIKKKLERLLEEDQVFKENELRLDDLASYMDITRHQLSQVINEHYQINFFELLNRYRVAYVKKVLLDPAYAQYTIIQIAYEAGFNNKASFNKYFKKEIGLTPSAYRIKEGIE